MERCRPRRPLLQREAQIFLLFRTAKEVTLRVLLFVAAEDGQRSIIFRKMRFSCIR